MTNFEKYKKELKAIGGSEFLVTKNGEVKRWNVQDCNTKCIFKGNGCQSAAWEWLFEEAEVLTEKEKELINTINSIKPKYYDFRYITRDIHNNVFLFTFKPYLEIDTKTFASKDNSNDYMRVDENLFKNVTSKTIFDIKLNKFVEI